MHSKDHIPKLNKNEQSYIGLVGLERLQNNHGTYCRCFENRYILQLTSENYIEETGQSLSEAFAGAMSAKLTCFFIMQPPRIHLNFILC